MRVLAIDYGDARTGIAVSDAGGVMTGDAFVIRETARDKLARRIAEEALARGVQRLVVGHPLNMDGSKGERAEKAARLAKALRAKTKLPVDLWDERRTTVEALGILHANGRRGEKGRAQVDAVAASLLLESYLRRLAADAPRDIQ